MGASLQALLSGLVAGESKSSIVDLACGGGKLLHFFKCQGYLSLAGVDVSSDQVSLSIQVTPTVHHEDVLAFLKSQQSAFDLITGLDIIEHFHKDEVLQFLDGCHGALNPGGRLILQTPNADSPWGGVHRYGDFTHEVCFNPNSLARLMRLTGFEGIESREQGPILWGYSASSTVRWFIWQCIRTALIGWNLVETGTSGSRVFTRVFLSSGLRAKQKLA